MFVLLIFGLLLLLLTTGGFWLLFTIFVLINIYIHTALFEPTKSGFGFIAVEELENIFIPPVVAGVVLLVLLFKLVVLLLVFVVLFPNKLFVLVYDELLLTLFVVSGFVFPKIFVFNEFGVLFD